CMPRGASCGPKVLVGGTNWANRRATVRSPQCSGNRCESGVVLATVNGERAPKCHWAERPGKAGRASIRSQETGCGVTTPRRMEGREMLTPRTGAAVLLAALAALLALPACSSTSGPGANLATGCVKHYDASTDYFP